MFTKLKRLFVRREQPVSAARKWFSDIGNLERLRAILADQTFIAASNIVLSESALSSPIVFRDPDRLQLYAAYNAGINDFLSRLEQLAVAPHVTDLPAEWDHIEPTEL